ncbi:MAG: hypothetical protein IJZ20_08665, partial [Clostridia bacterium]|nr:hypothetical protein [Clostridia bacterium]
MRKFISMLLTVCMMLSLFAPVSALSLEEAEEYGDKSQSSEAALQNTGTVYASGKQNVSFDLGEGDWSIVDDGGTEAEVSGSTLVAAGYSGVVTVTDGSVTKTVHLLGGTKWKPGLNFLTG